MRNKQWLQLWRVMECFVCALCSDCVVALTLEIGRLRINWIVKSRNCVQCFHMKKHQIHIWIHIQRGAFGHAKSCAHGRTLFRKVRPSFSQCANILIYNVKQSKPYIQAKSHFKRCFAQLKTKNSLLSVSNFLSFSQCNIQLISQLRGASLNIWKRSFLLFSMRALKARVIF